MARLTAGQRKKLPGRDFALPSTKSKSGGSGGYPIPDKGHAKAALSMVSRFGSSAQKAEVKAKVAAKYPGMGKKKGK